MSVERVRGVDGLKVGREIKGRVTVGKDRSSTEGARNCKGIESRVAQENREQGLRKR